MKPLHSSLLASATLAGVLATASSGFAHEARSRVPGSVLAISSPWALSHSLALSGSLAPSSLTPSSLAPSSRLALSSALVASPMAMHSTSGAALDVESTATSVSDPSRPAADVEQLLREPPARQACANPCGGPKKSPVLGDELLSELGALPVIGTVMAPVTRGVTIETGEGKPTLTFAVKPTKITRGSGLVAIGRF